jgi:four helix bundle protein
MRSEIETVWDLKVFQKAYALSLEIHQVTKTFPKEELFGLTSQTRRASKGICANIAEGFAKQGFSSGEFKRFLSIAIGSSEEMKIWTQYCFDTQLIEQSIYHNWINGYDEISKMLHGLHKSWK